VSSSRDVATRKLTRAADTPWDEPTSRSPEYSAYLTGELFKYEPWPRLSPDMLCACRPSHIDHCCLC
jgi:hypothetical protein